MKAALIPPIPHLQEFARGPFHLLLAHLLSDRKYKAHYTKVRKAGGYLVLDNSAHEKGRGQDPAELMAQGLTLDAQEIVVPDVLEDWSGTVEAALCAHEVWFENGAIDIIRDYNPAFMYVPQGETPAEWLLCFKELLRIHNFMAAKHGLRRDFVLGVSKDYDVWEGGLDRLIYEFVIPARTDLAYKGLRLQVHLLGWSRNLITLNELARRFPWIRSTDSAKPFVYALSGIDLVNRDLKNPPPYPRRKRSYFKTEMSAKQSEKAWNNAWLFRECALGRIAA